MAEVEAIVKIVSAVGAIGVLTWLVILLTRGDLVSSKTVNEIITRVTSEIVTKIQDKLIDHERQSQRDHQAILSQLEAREAEHRQMLDKDRDQGSRPRSR
jgi:hypothetical protein